MSAQRIRFEKLWQQMQDAVVADEHLPTVLGGRFEADNLTQFLNQWFQNGPMMPWRIWKHISFIEFSDAPQEPEYLQRAELFGDDGHLSLRREGNRWLWHFIGTAGTTLPAGVKGDPWKLDGSTPLRCYPDKTILWGEEIRENKDDPKTGIGLWWEDRVGAANLKYPSHLSGISRVYLHFDRYTQAGRTVFVWYRGLGNREGVRSWPQE